MSMNLASYANLDVFVQINFRWFTRCQFVSYSSSQTIPRKAKEQIEIEVNENHSLEAYNVYTGLVLVVNIFR